MKKHKSFTLLTKILWISQNEERMGMYAQLLIGCGYKVNVLSYFIGKRIFTGVCLLLGILAYLLLRYAVYVSAVYSSALLCIALVGLALFLLDKTVLEWVRKKRSEHIVQEIYVISNQLLYYYGSRMNLHTKLMKCISYTKTMRNEMYLLTSEWYEDAESAIRRFKQRLGTDEGYSFGETLNSLRLHESENYYDLLRQRNLDYKEKIELNKESKKETNSYILFILAGIPILNTFRVFIYPWVQEGQKLFQSLN